MSLKVSYFLFSIIILSPHLLAKFILLYLSATYNTVNNISFKSNTI